MTVARKYLCLMSVAAALLSVRSAAAQDPYDDAAADDAAADDAAADDAGADDAGVDDFWADDFELPPMSILGGQEGVPRITGSAHRIGEEELNRYEDDDIHNTVSRVPGVYVRGEDGYGLRPNIGMRGANSDRSKKLTLMEDGVLSSPAPYAAPAAYYFPLVTRMTAVEVFKGPAAILHGPHTIGGAINLLSRSVPDAGHLAGADIALGAELYGKVHAYYGYGSKHAGWLVEAVRLRSDGFKELDPVPGGAPLPHTGFQRTELVAKGRINSDPDGAWYHEGALKFGFSQEVSNETYLGLTDADFRATPMRRYGASQLDQMRNHRTLAEARYRLDGQWLKLDATLYRHDFDRDWFKLNGLDSAVSLSDVLANPTGGTRAVLYRVISGQEDSTGTGTTLRLGSNDRRFVAQGAQVVASVELPTLGVVEQRLRVGGRYHYDEARRRHTEQSYAMRAGRLEREAGTQRLTSDNQGSAHAVAGYAMDEIAIHGLSVTPGIRAEWIDTTLEDFSSGEKILGNQQVLLPGVGVLYNLIQGEGEVPGTVQVKDANLALLAGVYQGFSPLAPGQAAGVEPEVSVNYEAGARLGYRGANVEAIGFFNDYSNLTAECTFSKGCVEERLGEQINGGEVNIWGVEASASHEVVTRLGLTIPLRMAYTFTRSRFLTSFTSDNPQFGEVAVGDELPYVPEHLGSLSLGAFMNRWGINLTGTYMGAMRESAGQGEPADGDVTDAFAVLGGLAWVNPLEQVQVYLKAENILDNHYIVSRRPFGARPGRPRFVQVGVRSAF